MGTCYSLRSRLLGPHASSSLAYPGGRTAGGGGEGEAGQHEQADGQLRERLRAEEKARLKADKKRSRSIDKSLKAEKREYKQTHRLLLLVLLEGTLSRFIPSSRVTEDSLIYGLFPGTHTETDIRCCWQVINSVKDALWAARSMMVFQHQEMSVAECCRLAHSRLQDYVLRDALVIGAAAAKARWGRTTV